MKKKIFAVASLALICASTAFAQGMRCRNEAESTGMSDNEYERSGITEQRFDFSVPFYGRLKDGKADGRERITPGNYGIAFISANTDAIVFDNRHSIEIFLNPIVGTYRRGPHLFSYGIGISAKDLVIIEEMMTKTEDGKFVATDWPEYSKNRTSRLEVASVAFPVTYSYDISNGVGFTVGPVLNLNVYSSLTNRYKIDGEKQKVKYSKVHCNPVTVDLMLQINVQDFGFYVRYSPMNLMNTKYWPGFQQWSAGLTLNL